MCIQSLIRTTNIDINLQVSASDRNNIWYINERAITIEAGPTDSSIIRNLVLIFYPKLTRYKQESVIIIRNYLVYLLHRPTLKISLPYCKYVHTTKSLFEKLKKQFRSHERCESN